MVIVKQKYRLGHLDMCVYSLFIKKTFPDKVSKENSIWFWKQKHWTQHGKIDFRSDLDEEDVEPSTTALELARHKLLSREVLVSRSLFNHYAESSEHRSSLLAESRRHVGQDLVTDLRKHTKFRAAEQRLRNRSIFGLPIVSQGTAAMKWWVALIYVLDATYAAFLLPIEISFDLFGSSAIYVDTTAGQLFA